MKSEINIELNDPSQAFRSNIPPFLSEKTLTRATENFIVEKAISLPRNAPIQINFIIPSPEQYASKELGDAAIRHFIYRKERMKYFIRKTIRLGFQNLAIGFVFLGLMIIILRFSNWIDLDETVGITFRETLLILGWVALWRPAEQLLFEWHPYRSRMRLFRRLSESHIEWIKSNQLI